MNKIYLILAFVVLAVSMVSASALDVVKEKAGDHVLVEGGDGPGSNNMQIGIMKMSLLRRQARMAPPSLAMKVMQARMTILAMIK